MFQQTLGKNHLKRLTLLQVAEWFHNEEVGAWLEESSWPDGPFCPHNVQSNIKHKTMIHLCRECEGRPMLTERTSSVMEGTNIKYRA